MTTIRDTWISAETEVKERDFRGILAMHAAICKGIRQRHGITVPYLYADLYAGPGNLSYCGRAFDGSPLIARDTLTRAGLPYEAIHFERDPEVAGRLGEALWVPASLLDIPDPETSPVYAEPCQQGFPRWLDSAPGSERHGIIYSDPIGDPIPVDLFNQAADRFPRVDLLAYVAANSQYKRKGGSARTRWLADDIAAINKRVVLIRRPHTAFQWTFILWSNWTDLPEWEKRGFYRLDSPTGRQILDQVNLTAREHHEKANTPLFGDRHYQRPEPGDAQYRTYAEYLRHPRFLAIKAEVFERANGLCERCGLRPPTEPHHLRYPPWGAFDVPSNLIAICHQCHCDAHGKAA